MRDGRAIVSAGVTALNPAGAGEAQQTAGEKGLGHVGRKEPTQAEPLLSRGRRRVDPERVGPGGTPRGVATAPLVVAGRAGPRP